MKKIIVIAIVSILVILSGCNQDELNRGTSKSEPSLQPIEKQDVAKVFTPNLVGKDREEAIDILKNSEIKYDIIEIYNENIEVDYVINQSILPQTKIDIDDLIVITISKGSEFVSAPEVIAMTKEESITIIESKLLKYDIVEIHNNLVNENIVISQNPIPNQRVKIGDTITVHVSLGYKKIQMEDLLNHTEAFVKAYFNGVNLKYSISYEYSNTVAKGMVISQSVDKNNYANEGDTINIVISDGFVLFEVENYTGKDVNIVKELLSGKCNLEIKYDYNLEYEHGVVIGQNIEAGNLINIENSIVLTINNMDEKPVYFTDENLELIIRDAIKKPEGQLYYKDVKGVQNINNHDIAHEKIYSLKGIENLKSLGSLYLFGENIVDVTPLAELTELVSLNLEWNDIQDISSLKNLVKLENIALSANPITDISILGNMKELVGVSLSGCPIDSISVIKDYIYIDFLNISNTNVDPHETKEIISKFTRLRAIHMNNIKVGDLDFLTSFNTTTHISAENCDLKDIVILEKFKYLRSLRISHNRIQDISPIKELINLESLLIGYNEIEDISALENLIYIEYLFISKINVTDFSVLKNLINLEDLYISSNIIKDIEFLNEYKYLEYLEIGSSKVLDKTNYDEIINKLRDSGCNVRG